MNPTVLLVEDEPLIRTLAADMLDVLGLCALQAGAAREAMDIVEAEEKTFEAAMVDLGLPDRPGEDLIRELRRLRPTLPVIVTTGRSRADVADDLRGDGIIFLGKPYQLSDLEEAVAALRLGA